MSKAIGDYTLTERLGKGSYAEVFKAVHQPTHEEYAIKVIPRNKLTPKLQENLESEIKIMRDHHHPNIVRLFDILKTENNIYLVLEYCAGGDLQKFIQRHKRLSEAVSQRFMRQLAEGLRFLSSKDLIHRDIKPQNLLLTEFSVDACIKIADFGFARHLGEADLAQTLCGTPLYMAPEIMQYRHYDGKADLWSVGAVLYEMLTGKPPFTGENQAELYRNIQTKPLCIPRGVSVSPDCLTVLQQLLERIPTRRASLQAFCSSRFIALQDVDEERKDAPLPNPTSAVSDLDMIQSTEATPAATASEEKQWTGERLRPLLTTTIPSPAGTPLTHIRTYSSNKPPVETTVTAPSAFTPSAFEPFSSPIVANYNQAIGFQPLTPLTPFPNSTYTQTHLLPRTPVTPNPRIVADPTTGNAAFPPPQSPQLGSGVGVAAYPTPNPPSNLAGVVGVGASTSSSPHPASGILRVSPFKPPETSPGGSALRHSQLHPASNSSRVVGSMITSNTARVTDWGGDVSSGARGDSTNSNEGGGGSAESDDFVIVEPSAHPWKANYYRQEAETSDIAIDAQPQIQAHVPQIAYSEDQLTTLTFTPAERLAEVAVAITIAGDACVRSSLKGSGGSPSPQASPNPSPIPSPNSSTLQDALTLYMHGMWMLKEGIDRAVKIQLQSQYPHTGQMSGQLVLELRQRFDGILERAEQCKFLILTSSTDSSSGTSGNKPAEALMYQHALALAREAAVEELMGNRAALDMYCRARLLVEGVLLTCRDAQDKKVLQTYAGLFVERMNLIAHSNTGTMEEMKISSDPDTHTYIHTPRNANISGCGSSTPLKVNPKGF